MKKLLNQFNKIMKKVVHLVHTITFIICLLITNGCKSSKASCSDNKNKKSAKTMYAQHKKSNSKYNRKSYIKKVSLQQKKCKK